MNKNHPLLGFARMHPMLVNFFFGLMAFVTNTDSDQMAIINGHTSQLKPNEAHGRVRIAYFKFTTLASGGADGDSYNMCQIPKGARIIDYLTSNEALGASVVAAIGITGSTSKYGSAIDMAAAGADRAAPLVAAAMLETTALETLIMTLTGAAPAATKIVKGFVLYVID